MRNGEMLEKLLKLEAQGIAWALNSTDEEIEETYEELRGKIDLTLDQVKELIACLKWIFDVLIQRKGEEFKDVEDFLTKQWREADHRIVVSEGGEVFADVGGRNAYNSFWVQLVTDFLYGGLGWRKKLGRCKNCGRWFVKSRADHVFCSDSCRGTYNKRRWLEERRRGAGVPSYSSNKLL